MPGHYATIWPQIKGKFLELCKHCTLHGVYYLTVGSKWLHVCWLAIVLASFGLCCFLSHMIWDKFAVDPTLTVVETTHYSTADIPFPAVAVCDPELVFYPNTENITNLLILRGYNRTQIAEFYQSFPGVRSADYAASLYVTKMHYLLDDLGYPYKTLLDMFKRPCEDLLVECYWRSRPHNCSEMFRPVYTVVGHCCQFDVPYFKNNTASPTNFISGVQPTEALEVVVGAGRGRDDTILTDGNILLYVFDQQNSITLLENAIVVTPLAYFDVNVYLWAIDSSSYVKALGLHARKCILNTDPGVGVSFYLGCMTRHILRRVVEHCRCLPFEYTARQLDVEGYVSCTWDRLGCVYQAVAKVEANVREIISNNECYQRCDYVQYETEVEYLKNHRAVNDIYSRVTVHFSEITCMKYRREVLYTWDQMMANLGGIFGLCLGGSIISIIEIVWFLLDVLITSIQHIFKKSQLEDNARHNRVFVNQASKKNKRNKICVKNPQKMGTAEFRFKFVN